MNEERNQRFRDIYDLLIQAKMLWDGSDDDRITQFEECKWQNGLNWCVNALQFVSRYPDQLPYTKSEDILEIEERQRMMEKYFASLETSRHIGDMKGE